MTPAQNRLRRFYGILRVPKDALGYSAMVELRVVFGLFWSILGVFSKMGNGSWQILGGFPGRTFQIF